MSLYASGRTTGIVLDSGDGVSHAVPVYEGFAMPSSIRRIDVAGRDVTEHLQLLFRKSGYVFHTSAEKEVVRAIKEKNCYVASDPKNEEKEWQRFGGVPEGKIVEYPLPDGQKIKVHCRIQGCKQTADIEFRLELSDSERLKYFSIPKSLASSTQAYTRLWLMQ